MALRVGKMECKQKLGRDTDLEERRVFVGLRADGLLGVLRSLNQPRVSRQTPLPSSSPRHLGHHLFS